MNTLAHKLKISGTIHYPVSTDEKSPFLSHFTDETDFDIGDAKFVIDSLPTKRAHSVTYGAERFSMEGTLFVTDSINKELETLIQIFAKWIIGIVRRENVPLASWMEHTDHWTLEELTVTRIDVPDVNTYGLYQFVYHDGNLFLKLLNGNELKQACRGRMFTKKTVNVSSAERILNSTPKCLITTLHTPLRLALAVLKENIGSGSDVGEVWISGAKDAPTPLSSRSRKLTIYF